MKLDPEDQRILDMTREELDAELAKHGETFEETVAKMDAARDRAIREARVLRAIFDDDLHG